MQILAIESSGAGCSAALWRDGAVAATHGRALERGHAAALMPLVRDTMADADWAALTAIVVTVGPGSFTGIRVGLAAARGLGLARGLPVHGVTSFEVIAAAVPPAVRGDAALAVLIESGRASRFLQSFDAALRPLAPAAALELDALAAALPAPPCLMIAAGKLPAGIAGDRRVVTAQPDAAILAALAAARLAAGGVFVPPTPLYLRAPDATPPRAGGRIRA